MGRLTSLPSAVVTDDSVLGGAEIERSLRFNDNDSAHLNRTPSSASNRRTWTWSGWVKRGELTSTQGRLFGAGHTSSDYFSIYFPSGDEFRVLWYEGSQKLTTTTAVFTDSTSWYHFVVAVDTTQADGGNRILMYANGVLLERIQNDPAQNFETSVNSTVEHNIGKWLSTVASYFDGYIAEVNFVDGFQLTPSSFGYTDFQTGLWRPKGYFGSYGTNGFRLDFSDNSAATSVTLGKDRSGQGNDYTPNNFATSDSLTDTPTKNFCTLNSLNATNDVDLREGNLEFFQSSNDESATATFGITSGKWYWEVYKNSGENPELGIDVVTRVLSNKTNDVSPTKVCIRTNGGDQQVGTGTPQSITGSSGGLTGAGVLAIAVDFDNKKIWYSDLSGNFFNSGNPATGANAAFTFSSVAVADECVPYFFCGTGGNHSFNINFGQDGTFAGHTTAGGNKDASGLGDFKYPVPSGYRALCSNNLPITTPPIINPKKHFDTLLYTGDGSTGRSITGLQFQPDFVWIKSRTNTRQAQITNSMVGAGKILVPSETDAEQTISGVSSFNHNGFTIGSHVGANENSQNFVAWCWKAGGASVSNSDGTITSQVSVNREAGFSIATWTSNGSGSPTSFGHGLGIRPDFILIKSRDSNYNWTVWSSTFSNATNNFLILNINNGTQTAGAAMWGTIDSSVVNYRHSANSSNGDDMVGFFFSSVKGFSKFGSYTGNGSSNGPYVYLGFRPAWVMIKMSGSTGHWIMFDNKRDPFNHCDTRLYANQTNADTGSYNVISMLSDGFKFENQYDGSWNSNGTKFIYLAFAEQIGNSPFVTETNAR